MLPFPVPRLPFLCPSSAAVSEWVQSCPDLASNQIHYSTNPMCLDARQGISTLLIQLNQLTPIKGQLYQLYLLIQLYRVAEKRVHSITRNIESNSGTYFHTTPILRPTDPPDSPPSIMIMIMIISSANTRNSAPRFAHHARSHSAP